MENVASAALAAKAFRERVYYHQKKGLSRTEAIERARNPRPRNLSIRSNFSVLVPSETAHQNSQNNQTESDNHLSQPETRNQIAENIVAKDPTRQEVQTEIQKLKRLGVMTEIKNDSEPEETSSYSPEKESPLTAIELFICVIVVGFSTWILVKSSAEVFHYSLEGWIKAAIVEIGICGFAIYSPKATLQMVLGKIAAICLVALSVMTLYSGVYRSETSSLQTLQARNEKLELLRADRQLAIEAFNKAPKAEKLKASEVVQSLTQKITDEMGKTNTTLSQSLDASAIEKDHLVEMLYRLAFVVMNIGFAGRARVLIGRIGSAPLIGGTASPIV